MKPIIIKDKKKNYLLNLSINKKSLSSYPYGSKVLFNSGGMFQNIVIIAGYYMLEQLQEISGKQKAFEYVNQIGISYNAKKWNFYAQKPNSMQKLQSLTRLQFDNQRFMNILAIAQMRQNLLDQDNLQNLVPILLYFLLALTPSDKIEQIFNSYKSKHQTSDSNFLFNLVSRFQIPAAFIAQLHFPLIAEAFKLHFKIFTPSLHGLKKSEYGNPNYNTLHLLVYSESTAVILYPKREPSIVQKFKGFIPFFEDYFTHSTAQPTLEGQASDPLRGNNGHAQQEELKEEDCIKQTPSIQKLQKYAKGHQLGVIRTIKNRIADGSQSRCSNCGGVFKHLAKLTCEHIYCARCIQSPKINGALIRKLDQFLEGRMKDCLMPGCLGKLVNKGNEKQIDLPVCSSCGSLAAILEFIDCKHRLCRFCVTALYSKQMKVDRCPFTLCRGRIPSAKVKEDIVEETKCKYCEKYILAATNPRCFSFCPQQYCDICLKESLTQEWVCKTCDHNHQWLQQFYEEVLVEMECDTGQVIPTRWDLDHRFSRCKECKKRIFGRRYDNGGDERWRHLACRDIGVAKKEEGRGG